MDLVRQARFTQAFVFKYSPRPGTVGAARLPDDVPDAVKRRRNNDLLALVEEIAGEKTPRSWAKRCGCSSRRLVARGQVAIRTLRKRGG